MNKLALKIAQQTRETGLYKVETHSIYNKAAKLAEKYGMIQEYSQAGGHTVYRSVRC